MSKQATFTVVSWNVNGIRTVDIRKTLNQFQCDILAIQETKISRDRLPKEVAVMEDYTSYFAFCRKTSGYAGVATYCHQTICPVKAEEGLWNSVSAQSTEQSNDIVGNYSFVAEIDRVHARQADVDGRVVITEHLVKTETGRHVPLIVFNVYCPRLHDPDHPTDNTEYKQRFHAILAERAMAFVQKDSFVMLVGDFNISHKFIDQSCVTDAKAFMNTIYRKWMDDLFINKGFMDTFRNLNPTATGKFTCWSEKMRGRVFNIGSRLDYILVNKSLFNYVVSAEIHSDILGSDHCPVSTSFRGLEVIPSAVAPSMASKYFPEFKGKQKKLSEMLLFKTGTDSAQATCAPITPKDQAKPEKRKSGSSLKLIQTDINSFIIKKSKTDVTCPTSSPYSEVFASAKNKEADNVSSLSQCQAKNNSVEAWHNIMKAPAKPVCPGHNEPCTLRTVQKKGPTCGKRFWSCSRVPGPISNPEAQCKFFQWFKS